MSENTHISASEGGIDPKYVEQFHEIIVCCDCEQSKIWCKYICER